MAANNDEVLINGIRLPTMKKEGLTISNEKIWSKDTGRAANAEMVGHVVAVKRTLKCQWPPLTRAEVALIDSLVTGNAFFSVEYSDPGTNTRKTITAYAGTPTYPVYSYVDGVKTYQGVAVDLIEK